MERNDAFLKKLRALVVPIALQQLMLSVVGAADAVMLNLISQEKMAAVSLAGQITFVHNLFLAGMTIGFSALASQYWGKRERRTVEKLFAYVMKMTVAVSLIWTLLALCAPTVWMRLFTDDVTLIAGGAEYLRLVSPSFLLTGISQTYLCLMKNSEQAKKAGAISASCMLLDMVLNLFLIVGLCGLPRLEIAGAALSTTFARAVEVIACVTAGRKKGEVPFRWSNICRTPHDLRRDFWKYTTPILGNELVWGVGFASYSAMMGHLGADAVSANAIANIVKNLAVCFCLGLGSGGGILIGNELGAGHLSQAKGYGKRLCRLAILFGVLSGAVLLAAAPLVLRFVPLNAQSMQYLKQMLLICACYMVGKSVNSTVIAGIFAAGGDSKFGLICDAVTMWGITVPLGFLATFVFDLPTMAVYLIVNADECIKLPAVYLRYRRYHWVKDLTKKEESSEMKEKLHTGELYLPSDDTIMQEQTKCLDRLYDFNHTRPTEGEKRQAMLKEMFAEIGEGCYIEPPFYSNFGGRHIHFGKHIYCNFGVTMVDDTHIYVGDRTMFGPHVIVATAGHPLLPQLREQGYQYNASVRIGKNCWIGAGAILLPGVTIGDNVVVGAGSVVTKDLPSNVVAVGNPCKVLRQIDQRDREYYFKDRKIDWSVM